MSGKPGHPKGTGKRDMLALKPKQERFAVEYLKDLNATAAAERAGYATRSAAAIGCNLLKDPRIIAAIKSGPAGKALRRNEVTVERILDELAAVGFANMQDYVEPEMGPEEPEFDDNGQPNGKMTAKPTGWFQVRDITALPRGLCAAISEVTVDESGGGAGDGKREKVVRIRLKMHDKLDALSMLGKYKKMFTERIEVGLSEELLARLDRGRQRLLTLKAGNNGNGNGNGNGSAHPGPVAR